MVHAFRDAEKSKKTEQPSCHSNLAQLKSADLPVECSDKCEKVIANNVFKVAHNKTHA